MNTQALKAFIEAGKKADAERQARFAVSEEGKAYTAEINSGREIAHQLDKATSVDDLTNKINKGTF